MGYLPPFIFHFKFHHKAAQPLLKYLETNKEGLKRAWLAKLVLLHEIEKDFIINSALTEESSNKVHSSEEVQTAIKIAIHSPTELQIQRQCGLAMHVIAWRRGQVLCVRVVNVGGTAARVLNMTAGCAEVVPKIVLFPAAGLRKWIGLWSQCVVEVAYIRGRACVTFGIV